MTEIRQEVLDELLEGYSCPDDLVGPDGLLKKLVGRLVERASQVELTEHLGYESGDPVGRGSGNSRNGTTAKTLLCDAGEVRVNMARDRAGTFEPQIVAKGDTHWKGFDDKIVAMYAGGMSQGDIADHLREIYGVGVSKDLISRVTDGVLDDVREWQARGLDACYPVIWIDALVVKVRVDGVVRNRPAYLVLGLNIEGRKEPLSLVIGSGGDESAVFWAKVLNDIRNRGVTDIGVACCDGLSGLPEAIERTWGDAWVQTCVVHLIRNSLKHVTYKDRRDVARDLKPIYRAPNEDAALAALEQFEEKWSAKYPMIAEAWTRTWERFTPFLAFPPEIRRIIYTTNAIEATNRQLRKVIKNRGHFPTEDAATKLLWLALIKAETKWKMPIRQWPQALHQFAVFMPETIGKHIAI